MGFCERPQLILSRLHIHKYIGVHLILKQSVSVNLQQRLDSLPE